MSNPEHSAVFLKHLEDIKDLYAEVKEIIILAENFDSCNDVYLSPLNELRNTLDHIMRSFIYPHKVESELNEATEHLYRAGYDAYEVLAINIISKIIGCVEKYNVATISVIFPEYYTEIKQEITNIKIGLADERAHKRLDPDTGTKSFTPYKEKVAKLLRFQQICEMRLPDLQKEKRKQKLGGLRSAAASFVTGVIITIAGAFVYDSYIKGASAETVVRQPQLHVGDSASHIAPVKMDTIRSSEK